MRKLVVARRASQGIFFLLFLSAILPLGRLLPGLSHPGVFFRIDPFIMFSIWISERVIFSGLWIPLAMLLLTLVLGRFFCGWICPLGTMTDWAGALRKKERVIAERTNRKIRNVKFYVLGLAFLSAVSGGRTAWGLDPMVMVEKAAGTIVALVRHLQPYVGALYGFSGPTGPLFPDTGGYFPPGSEALFSVFLIVCGAALFVPRWWCRMICPLGALYSILARISFLRRVVAGSCAGCNACVKNCRMGAIRDDGSYAAGECILCMDCVYDCPRSAAGFTLRRGSTGPGQPLPRSRDG